LRELKLIKANKKEIKKKKNDRSRSVSESSSKTSFNFSSKDLKILKSPYATNKATYTIKSKKKK